MGFIIPEESQPWIAWMETFSATAAKPQRRPVRIDKPRSAVLSGTLRKRALRGAHINLFIICTGRILGDVVIWKGFSGIFRRIRGAAGHCLSLCIFLSFKPAGYILKVIRLDVDLYKVYSICGFYRDGIETGTVRLGVFYKVVQIIAEALGIFLLKSGSQIRMQCIHLLKAYYVSLLNVCHNYFLIGLVFPPAILGFCFEPCKGFPLFFEEFLKKYDFCLILRSGSRSTNTGFMSLGSIPL